MTTIFYKRYKKDAMAHNAALDEAFKEELRAWWMNLAIKTFNDVNWFRNKSEEYWFRWDVQKHDFAVFQHRDDRPDLQDHGEAEPKTHQEHLQLQKELIHQQLAADQYKWVPPQNSAFWDTWADYYKEYKRVKNQVQDSDAFVYTNEGTTWRAFYKETSWWTWEDEAKTKYKTYTHKEYIQCSSSTEPATPEVAPIDHERRAKRGRQEVPANDTQDPVYNPP